MNVSDQHWMATGFHGVCAGSLSQSESPSDLPVDKASSPDAPVETKSRFWMSSLVAGCCFALGYGITERVLMLQANAEDPVPEAFTPLAFPGDSLQEIRARFSDDAPSLQVDVTALEAASRPAKPAVKGTSKPDLALQTPESLVLSDPQTTTPEMEKDNGPIPSSAQEPALEFDDSNVDSLVLPEESIEARPAVVVQGRDSPVFVAEPEPLGLPPGAEAFFEAIKPMPPLQP